MSCGGARLLRWGQLAGALPHGPKTCGMRGPEDRRAEPQPCTVASMRVWGGAGGDEDGDRHHCPFSAAVHALEHHTDRSLPCPQVGTQWWWHARASLGHMLPTQREQPTHACWPVASQQPGRAELRWPGHLLGCVHCPGPGSHMALPCPSTQPLPPGCLLPACGPGCCATS